MTPIPAGWKPIESAPKDGTPVLLFARHIDAEASTRVVGWFNADYGWIAQSYIGQPFARLIPSQWAELLPFPGSPASVAPGDAQAVAWMNPETQDVITNERKDSWLTTYGVGMAAKAAAYSQPLGVLAAPAAGDALDLLRLRRIAWLIGSIFVHGDFKAETVNERELEKLLRENGTFWDSLAQFDAALAAQVPHQDKGDA